MGENELVISLREMSIGPPQAKNLRVSGHLERKISVTVALYQSEVTLT